VARRYVAPDDARDVAQRTFVRAFERIRSFRGESAFRTWLRRIAHNIALNHLRDGGRMQRLDELVDLPDQPPSAGASSNDDLIERLGEAVARLPPKQRLVVELRVLGDRSFREIAATARCTEESAKANFHHATKRLKQWLADDEKGTPPRANVNQ
jgi:RNA polymerase sigma-70 factor (ECF subfamily)